MYNRHEFKDKETVLTAEIMQDIEDGICANEEMINENKELIYQTQNVMDNTISENLNSFVGNTISIKDSKEAPLEVLEIYGKTEQDTTEGKNLLDCSGLTEQTIEGVTFTPVFDNKGRLQYVNVNGPATADKNAVYSFPVDLTVGETYTLSGCPSGGSTRTYFLQISYFGNDVGNGWTQTVTEQTNKLASIIVWGGTTANNLKFYPMIRLASITDGTYEPFTNGASPNPQFPQPLRKVILSEIKTCGKNVFGFGKSAIDKTAELRPQSTQRLRMSLVDENNVNKIKCAYSNGSWTFGYIEINGIDGTKDYSITYTVEENTTTYSPYMRKAKDFSDANKLVLQISGGNDAVSVGSTEYFVLSNIQVELGTTATDYEPYTESVATLSNPITMNGLNGVQDTLESKKYKTVVFDGSDDENWRTSTKYATRYYTHLSDSKNGSIVLCTQGVMRQSTQNGSIGIDSNLNFLISTEFETLADWKAHLASKPMTVVYELAEPIETPLPDADVEALKSLRSYDGVTHIFVDSGEVEPEMKVLCAKNDLGVVVLENDKEIQEAKMQAQETKVQLNQCLQIVSFDEQTGTLITKSFDYNG